MFGGGGEKGVMEGWEEEYPWCRGSGIGIGASTASCSPASMSLGTLTVLLERDFGRIDINFGAVIPESQLDF